MSLQNQVNQHFGTVKTSTILSEGAALTIRANNSQAVSIADDIVTGNVNIGTGAVARTVTIGNSTGASALVLTSGTGGITIPSGNVSQATSITTAVTDNKVSGIITTVSSTLAANATATFTVNNSLVTASSRVYASVVSYSGTYATNGLPCVNVGSIASGSFAIQLFNAHGTNALSGTVSISFLVVN